jgi:sugar transferase EpsL
VKRAGAARVGLAVKRGIDVGVGSVATLVSIPLVILLAGAMTLLEGPPIFFSQERVGLGGKLFEVLKFRTMSEARAADGVLLPDEQRITRAGRLLRRFRLDELPSLFAIVTGEMSLVGPRPLPTYVLDTLTGTAERHQMRPGFTGLAQVSGATLLTNPEKMALDTLYVRTWSLALDTLILLKTVRIILFGERRDEELIARALSEL